MKRSLLLILVVFASISISANTYVHPTVKTAATKAVPTPDFTYAVIPLTGTSPLLQYARIHITNPLPADFGQISNVDWDFGDGTPPALNARVLVNHFYQPGTYTVTLTLTYVTGEVFVVTHEVVVPAA